MSGSRPTDITKEMDIFKEQIKLFQSQAIDYTKVKPEAVKDQDIAKIFKTYENLLTDANRKLAIINDLTEKQLILLKAQAAGQTTLNSANKEIVHSLELLAIYTKSSTGSTDAFDKAQTNLTQAYKNVLPVIKTNQEFKAPDVTNINDHTTDISSKLNALKSAINSEKTKLSQTGVMKDILSSGVEFLDSLLSQIQTGILEIHDSNCNLHKKTGSLVIEAESLKNQIRSTLVPVVKVKAQLEKAAHANASNPSAGHSAPLSSSHGSQNKVSQHLANAASQSAPVHPAPNGDMKAKGK